MHDDAGWLGALLAVTLFGWALQPTEHTPTAHVPVQDTTAFRNDLPIGQLDFPLPDGTEPSGRISRQSGTHGDRTVGRFRCPLPPPETIAWFRQRLPGRLDVLERDGEATVHQTASDRRSTIRVVPAGGGSELFLVVRDY